MLIQGATARIQFDLSNKIGAIDLTGAAIYFVYRHGMFGESSETTCEITDAPGGQAQIILTPEQTNDEGQFYYQLRIEFEDGTVLKSEKCSMYIEASL